MQNIHTQILTELLAEKNDKQAEILQRFFKTNKGQYGYGDLFWGIKVPIQRRIAKKYYKKISLTDLQKIISSKFHECRLTSLLILTYQFPHLSLKEKKSTYDFYIKNLNYINNWDLVDLSAPNIVGAYLSTRSPRPLYNLAKSKNIWHRRIAIISCFYFIKNNNFTDALKISKILLHDNHDLIHKAVGWMLREIGKRNETILIEYLDENYRNMPRTMLRYSIEKFPENTRKKYLAK